MQRKRPGPPPGTHHAGTFKPGHDPRRAGDPHKAALKREINLLCQEHTQDAVDLLVTVMNAKQEATKARLAAAELLISYGHGRPVSREQHISIVQQGEAATKPQRLSDDELLSMIQGRFRAEAQTLEGQAERVESEQEQGVGAGNFLEMGKE